MSGRKKVFRTIGQEHGSVPLHFVRTVLLQDDVDTSNQFATAFRTRLDLKEKNVVLNFYERFYAMWSLLGI